MGMTIPEAVDFIRAGVPPQAGVWADLGAGAGLFTLALQSLLPGGKVLAIDKNPHALWRLERSGAVAIEIREADFTRPMDLPPVDGMLMANALHYAPDPAAVLRNVLQHLRPGAPFILIEYDTNTPLSPWVPYPLPADRFAELSAQVGLQATAELNRRRSRYGHGHLYAMVAHKGP